MTVDHVTNKGEYRYARLDRLPMGSGKLQPSIRHRCFAENCCYLVRGEIWYNEVYSGDVSGRAVKDVGLWQLACWIAVSNPAGGISVCCGCCVLSGRGICDRLITRPEESCRVWCV